MEHACAGPTGTELIADLETIFSAQDIHYFIAIAMEVKRCLGTRRRNLFESHHTFAGFLIL